VRTGNVTREGAGFRSRTEAIDTTPPAGRMLMQMVRSFAEFERAMIRESPQAGLVAARTRGRIGSRRPKLGPEQQAEMVDMVQAGGRSQVEAARLFRVHPAMVSRLRTMHRQPAQTRPAELRITEGGAER
jgi:DNA invertase Pin-like site-specific DNA recombinase